ncbi:RhoGAP-domain-containing protein [Piedraia hortae CBS 480.64]|uniref:RhoGAP-domain-containing protein n=1 Tax=Piedraia hortae CBS 480.64 TaxID=1314780 RepID=A0A6A7C276_9PEZI|nr:RhoGAP-domain-containing protein [Piedraia hortae CBS 480.64]
MEVEADSPIDGEETVYPCKGCGEVLEEGKAFELSGNRWHIECFRCNTCGTLLDADASLLLLGDGSLICNDCTYSCNVCGDKIEDLAILTGDLAFCANCFKCRNCKRKIENLKYARTSHGIFCMKCHESLMASRRKRAQNKQPNPASRGGTPGVEKALPSLPPEAVPLSAFSPEVGSECSETPPAHKSPRPSLPRSRTGGSVASRSRDISPDNRKETLPASTYSDSRSSHASDDTEDGVRGFLPLAFDPTPAPGPPAPGVSRPAMSRPRAASAQSPVTSEPKKSSTHILQLDKGRGLGSPSASSEHFRLQDAPRRKERNGSRPPDSSGRVSPKSMDSRSSSINPFDDPRRKENKAGGMAPPPPRHSDRPKRGDSLALRNKTAPTDRGGRAASTSSSHGTPRSRNNSSSTVDAITVSSPPPRSSHRLSTVPSKTGLHSDFSAVPPALGSAGLSRHSAETPLSMEREMQRFMHSERQVEAGSSMLRRMSNAVKHGRSFSDRDITQSPSRTLEISSPLTMGSPTISSPNDPLAQLRAQNMRQQKQIAEQQASMDALREQINSSAQMRAAVTELNEKRNTITTLDAQREIVLAELNSIMSHLQTTKDGSDAPETLASRVSHDLQQTVKTLTSQLQGEIEQLMHRRNELSEEITALIPLKERALHELEELRSRNTQLQDMNNQLLQNIQDAHKGGSGLGISMDSAIPEAQTDRVTVVNAPQVVNIRKEQPKKFNWRRGGEKVAKNISKGVRAATLGPVPSSSSSQTNAGANSFNLFGPKANVKRGNGGPATMAVDSSTLFGSDLEARCEHEQRMVPIIVTRCIQEVEKRGMDLEGIYRKSGGSSQVKMIQSGFEREGANYDISDPDLDIHAVTSALKQYFRKLPTPLITYDVYENFLEAAQSQDRERQIAHLRAAVFSLPDHHRSCLEYLVRHLAHVMTKEAENLMTPLNLAVVFAPTIMRPFSIEREMSDMQAQRVAVQALLELYEGVFAE